jgi:hypothetical protein
MNPPFTTTCDSPKTGPRSSSGSRCTACLNATSLNASPTPATAADTNLNHQSSAQKMPMNPTDMTIVAPQNTTPGARVMILVTNGRNTKLPNSRPAAQTLHSTPAARVGAPGSSALPRIGMPTCCDELPNASRQRTSSSGTSPAATTAGHTTGRRPTSRPGSTGSRNRTRIASNTSADNA